MCQNENFDVLLCHADVVIPSTMELNPSSPREHAHAMFLVESSGPDGLLDGTILNSEHTGLTDRKAILQDQTNSELPCKIWQTK